METLSLVALLLAGAGLFALGMFVGVIWESSAASRERERASRVFGRRDWP